MLNADDPLVAAFAFHAPGRVLTYGIENVADFRAESIEDRGALGSTFVLTRWDKQVRLELSLAGRHVIANALAALAAASVWGITPEESREVLRNLRAPAMRGELLKLSNGAALINDSYNSSPAALHAMIAVLAATPGYRRRILAAGEMRELGATSRQLHREAGAFAAKTGKDGLGDRRSGGRGADCRRRGRCGSCRATQTRVFCVVGRSVGVSCVSSLSPAICCW